MDASPPRPSKWSDDAFLNQLRDLSDAAANECARTLPPDQSLAYLFTKMRVDADLPPDVVLPEAFAKFIRDARPSLQLDDLTGAEHEKLKRGQQVFMRHALPCSLILLSKSLQEGYQAPRLGKVLMMSGELESSTYRRVLGVLQMLIQVATPGSFEAKLKSDVLPASDAGLTAIKVRLMHAGLRGIAKGKFPRYTEQYGGEPISIEDMLATLIAFSWLVIDGFRILKLDLSDEDAEAYHFVWRVFARTMGVHPPGQPKSWDWVPTTVAEAREFYEAYSRRHYAPLEENEEGAMLANANLKMLARRMPPLAARIYMTRLLGPKASAALRIKQVPFLYISKAIYYNFPRFWVWLWGMIDKRPDGVAKHDRVTQSILQGLVLVEYEAGIPSYRVPREVNDIGEIVKGTQPGLNFGREQFLTQVFPAELNDIAARREALHLDAGKLRPMAATQPGKQWRPSTERNLIGLALSGGGIRSATFALGAVQALARRNCFKMFDYLSTVSGGGYMGSALSSMLNDKDAGLDGKSFPLDYETGSVEPPAIRHLRNGSNYLTGGGLLSQIRLPMIIVRGLLLNAVLVLPYVMLGAMMTAIVYPWTHSADTIAWLVFGTLALFLTYMISYPAVTWLWGRKRTWDQRNNAEIRQTWTMLLFGSAIVMAMLSGVISDVINAGEAQTRAAIEAEVLTIESTDWWKWAIFAIGAYALIRVGNLAKTAGKLTSRVLLYLLGLAAPAAVFGAYLLLLPAVARSPFLTQETSGRIYDEMMVNTDFAGTGEGVASDVTADSSLKLQRRLVHGVFLRDTTVRRALLAHGVAEIKKGAQLWFRYHDDTSSNIFDIVAIPPDAGDTLRKPFETEEGRDSVTAILDSLAWGLIREGQRPEIDSIERFMDSVVSNPRTQHYKLALNRAGDGAKFADLVRLAGGNEHGELKLIGVSFGSRPRDWWFAGAALLLFTLNGLWVDVNITSPHGFWRDRLSKVFLIRSRWFGRPTPNDALKLSEMGTVNPAVPYHLVNTSLNLTGSRVEDLPGRGSDFFMFSRRFCGSYSTGYCSSQMMEEADKHIDLGTAMAISAAATAPNSGTVTVKPLVFMLTLLNVRLDYWAPNPWYVQASSLVRQLIARVGRPGPGYLIRESIGSLHARGAFVNLSDGGHIENLAVYELLRRRCKLIVSVDAEQDPTMSCASLAKLIRYARIDLGVEIDIDLNPFNLDSVTGMTHRHWTLGTIRYGNGETGHLLYVKSSVTGDEAPYVADYRKRNPAFPQESTADQFFDEAQFESYRALGYHAMSGALKAAGTLDTSEGGGSAEELAAVRDGLGLKTARFTGATTAHS
jgi:hypothetical protein